MCVEMHVEMLVCMCAYVCKSAGMHVWDGVNVHMCIYVGTAMHLCAYVYMGG